jgi:hypothetical protein
VRRSTAIKNLRTLIDLCGRTDLPDADPTLLEVYAFGDILDPDIDDMHDVDVALVIDLPVEDVTWWSLPIRTAWIIEVVRLNKLPVRAAWRPSVWPVWNHAIRQPLRIWSAADGADGEALDALSNGQADALRLPAPEADVEAEQLATELEASLAHLKRVRDDWDDREWRRNHKGFGVYPEDHLWRAVHGYLDLLEATQSR